MIHTRTTKGRNDRRGKWKTNRGNIKKNENNFCQKKDANAHYSTIPRHAPPIKIEKVRDGKLLVFHMNFLFSDFLT